jgi:thymidylate kinase
MSEFRFVIDGPDGAGKTTLCAELKKYLLDRQIVREVVIVGDPNHVLSGPNDVSIRDILLDPHIRPKFTKAKQDHKAYEPGAKGPLPPAAAIPLILAGEAATLHALENLHPCSGNRVILFDRWTTSTLVYQVLGQKRSNILLPMVLDGYAAAHTHVDAMPMHGTFIICFDSDDLDSMVQRAHRGSDVYESADAGEHRAQLVDRNNRFQHLEFLRDCSNQLYWQLLTRGLPLVRIDAAAPIEAVTRTVGDKILDTVRESDPTAFRISS